MPAWREQGSRRGEADGGLEDRISVGVLARAFPRELVDEVIDAAGARERRRRVLPAWLTLYFTLALALFMDRGAARVMRKLAGVVAWAERGVTVTVPSEEALSNARARLGAEPLRLLFEKVAGFVAPAGAPGAWWRGLRLVSLDGTTLDAQDEQANWERFGGPSTKTADGRRLRGAFPQVRLLALAECGTRALVAAVHGGLLHGREDPGQGPDRPARRGDAVPGGPELRLLGAVARCGGDRGAAAVADRRVVLPAGG